jgi:hypothetical protein
MYLHVRVHRVALRQLTGFGALPGLTSLRQLSRLMGTKWLRVSHRHMRMVGKVGPWTSPCRAFRRRPHFVALTKAPALAAVLILTGRAAVTLADATPRPLHL